MAREMTEDVGLHHRSTRTGKLSTVRADGSPHIAPIWFLLDGADLVLTTERDTVNLAGRPGGVVCRRRAATLFLRGAGGRVKISEQPGQLLVWATSIAARYMGERRAREFGERNSVPGMLLVRMRIEHVGRLRSYRLLRRPDVELETTA